MVTFCPICTSLVVFWQLCRWCLLYQHLSCLLNPLKPTEFFHNFLPLTTVSQRHHKGALTTMVTMTQMFFVSFQKTFWGVTFAKWTSLPKKAVRQSTSAIEVTCGKKQSCGWVLSYSLTPPCENQQCPSVPLGLPWWIRWWRICLQCRRRRFHPWVEKAPWRRQRLPSPGLLPAEFHGQGIWRVQFMRSQRARHS